MKRREFVAATAAILAMPSLAAPVKMAADRSPINAIVTSFGTAKIVGPIEWRKKMWHDGTYLTRVTEMMEREWAAGREPTQIRIHEDGRLTID